MIQVKWTPMKNTEREAIRKHGDRWEHIKTWWRGPHGQTCLISSKDKLDLRWIFDHQIKGAEHV